MRSLAAVVTKCQGKPLVTSSGLLLGSGRQTQTDDLWAMGSSLKWCHFDRSVSIFCETRRWVIFQRPKCQFPLHANRCLSRLASIWNACLRIKVHCNLHTSDHFSGIKESEGPSNCDCLSTQNSAMEKLRNIATHFRA